MTLNFESTRNCDANWLNRKKLWRQLAKPQEIVTLVKKKSRIYNIFWRMKNIDMTFGLIRLTDCLYWNIQYSYICLCISQLLTIMVYWLENDFALGGSPQILRHWAVIVPTMNISYTQIPVFYRIHEVLFIFTLSCFNSWLPLTENIFNGV